MGYILYYLSGNFGRLMKDSKTDVAVVEVDGSMVLTLEDKWQEVKVGRIFRLSDTHRQSETRSYLKASLHKGYLGGHTDFLHTFEPTVDVIDGFGDRLVYARARQSHAEHRAFSHVASHAYRATHGLD